MTPKEREVMQMALEALELHGQQYPHMVKGYTLDAAEALRAALAQPEQDPVWGDSQVTKPEVIAGQKSMNEGLRKMVEQEPVAWMYDWYDETEDIDGVPIGGIVSDCISKDYDEAHSPTMGCHNIRPLYTVPLQHKWVGLTEMEVLDICNFAKGQNGFFFVREVEAKLREKNSG